MKGRGGAVVLLVVLAIVGWFYLGGSADAPENVPEPNAPSVDEASGGLLRFFDKIGSTISGWGELTWRLIAVFGLVGLLMWVFKKVPLMVWLILAVFGMVIAVMA